jgi:2'-hydroxyisoflavone reductase
MLEGIKTAVRSDAKFSWVSADFLEANKVAPWSDMPVWIPPRGDEAGANQISNQRALGQGLTFRPLAVTARDTLAWFKSQSAERQSKLKAGLAPGREAEVLAAWHKQKAGASSPS